MRGRIAARLRRAGNRAKLRRATGLPVRAHQLIRGHVRFRVLPRIKRGKGITA